MFFLLSKLLSFLLTPFSWLLLLLAWYILSKKGSTIRKKIAWAMAILLFVFTNPYIFHVVTLAWEVEKPVLDKQKHYQAGIILGGYYSFDKYGHGYFNQSCDRFLETIKLYHSGIIQKIVISGGSAAIFKDQPTEADSVYKEAIACGVLPKDIIKENQSKNTYENALFCKRIFDSLLMQGPYLLISSATHLRRAELVFKKVGLKIVSYPTDYMEVQKKIYLSDFIWPDASNIWKWSMLIKEFIGVAVYTITGKS